MGDCSASTSDLSGQSSVHSEGSSSSCLAPRTAENCITADEITWTCTARRIERRVGSGDTQLGQLRRQRLLNRKKQQRRSIALVCDGEKVLSFDQCRALRAGK